jgi:4'-phosphopantetheinyl transferase
MPLTDYIVIHEHTRVGVWRINEEEDYFLRKLPLSDREKDELEALKGHKRLEWLAARYLIQVMTGWAYSLVKDSFGKPFLHQSEYHISVSHSKDYTTAIIAPCLVGIDIQYITSKLERVAGRVMNDVKLKNLSPNNPLEHLHVYWGAKEALYKAYGKRELDFREHIPIEPFDYENTEGVVRGQVIKDDFNKDFDIYYKKIEHYILVYAIEKLGLNQRAVVSNR